MTASDSDSDRESGRDSGRTPSFSPFPASILSGGNRDTRHIVPGVWQGVAVALGWVGTQRVEAFAPCKCFLQTV